MDLNRITIPDDRNDGGGREIFDPVNAWPDASGRVYVATHRSSPLGVYQYGYDPETRLGWLRSMPEPGAEWSAWVGAGYPPPALAIASLNPPSMVVGGPDELLEVIGEGFTQASEIIFNGGAETTTFVDAGKLTTLVKPQYASGPITLPIYVRNHMRLSNTVNFAFTAATGEELSNERQIRLERK